MEEQRVSLRRRARYELLLPLGSGGMATVFAGREVGAKSFDDLVAIKRLHPHLLRAPELSEHLLAEARTLSAVRHPGVVRVRDVCRTEREFLLVMDYVHGPSLAELFDAAGCRVPLPIALRLLVDAALGLHAAHEQCAPGGRPLGLVHRDATPHNILVGEGGVTRVADFGFARASGVEQAIPQGNVRYMSPEQLAGQALDRRSDVFSLGVVLWELCAGRRMFGDLPEPAVMLQIADGGLPELRAAAPDLNAELTAIVEQAVSHDAETRFATALELAQALTGWAERHLGEPGLAEHRPLSDYVERVCGARLGARRAALVAALERPSSTE